VSQSKPIEIERAALEALLLRIKQQLGEADHATVRALADSHDRILQLLTQKNLSIARLRKLVFGPTTEKTRKLKQRIKEKTKESPASQTAGEAPVPANQDGSAPAAKPDGNDAKASVGAESSTTTPHKPSKGHGRHGAADFIGATHVAVPHESLKAGDDCPKCERGHLRRLQEPAPFVHLVGRAPIDATVFDLERLRCDACQALFTARAPEHTGQQKYDVSAPAMIALLRYGAGLPHYRLSKLQAGFGIPLAPSSQWDVIKPQVEALKPVFEELSRQAAQGELFHNDDTPMTVLSLVKEISEEAKQSKALAQEQRDDRHKALPERTGVYTSNILSVVQGHEIALFFTGRRHAGENIDSVLARRAEGLAAPLQMCDGLDRNLPKALTTIVGNCLGHSRRKYVDVAEYFPAECLHVLDVLAEVYKNDALTRQRQMGPAERLLFHQKHSGPLMDKLEAWIKDLLDSHKVEPNGGLGQAISYMIKRWDRLTLFLREPGAPLDNSICERAIKKAVIHRKNSLFYKTESGALAGDIFMSLIHTAELNGIQPFEYLVALMSNPVEIKQSPELWMPWNYRQTIESRAHSQSALSQAA